MPRKRQRKTVTRYDKDKLKEYVEEVKSGKSVYSVAKANNVPLETLRRWVVDPPRKLGSGGGTVLKTEEETLVATALQFLGKCGYPQDRNDVKDMVQSFLNSVGRNTPFTDNRPGKDWMMLFEKRNAHLITKRNPELLTKARAEGLSHGVVNLFFNMYTNLLAEHNLTDQPHRIFNLNETGLNTDPQSTKVCVMKGEQNAYIKSASCGKACYTVLFCASAAGKYLPPFTVYKGMNCYISWLSGGPIGASYDCTDYGWMTGDTFERWFSSIFLPATADLDKPVLLIFDGHNSHITYNTAKLAIDNEIILLCLPPNTSHALQPLDVGLFRSLKISWREVLKVWFRKSRLQTVDKAVLPSLLRKLWQTLKPEHVVAGFRGSGLFPVNKEAVKDRLVSTPNVVENTPAENIQEPTPRKKLTNAILSVISPEALEKGLDHSFSKIDFETESDSLVPVSIKEELLGYDEDDTEMKTWNFNLMNSHTIFSPQRYRDDPLIQVKHQKRRRDDDDLNIITGDPVERDPVEKVSIKEEAPDSDQIEAQYFKEIEQMEVFPDVEFNIKTEDDL